MYESTQTQSRCEMPAYQQSTTTVLQLTPTKPSSQPPRTSTTLCLHAHTESTTLLTNASSKPSVGRASPFVSRKVLRQYARLAGVILIMQLILLLGVTLYRAHQRGASAPTKQAASLLTHSRDALPRFPNRSVLGALRLLDYVGTISFAHSGANLAAAAGMDAFGAGVIGTVTAIGGGTLRDALILSRKPFWTMETEYVYLAFATALLAFLLCPAATGKPAADSPLEVFVDAVGVGAFCVIGAQNALREDAPVIVCMICGVATATFGGIFRDVLCKRNVRILHSAADIYATTALAGASFYMAAWYSGAGVVLRVAGGVLIAVVLRLLAWSRGLPLCSAASGDCLPFPASVKQYR